MEIYIRHEDAEDVKVGRESVMLADNGENGLDIILTGVMIHFERESDAEIVARSILVRLASTSRRYEVRTGSVTGHCCLTFSIIDTTADNQEYPVCECFNEEGAKSICAALNRSGV